MIIDFCAFNVRGLNNKVSCIRDFVTYNKLSLIGLLETRVHTDVAKQISSEVAPNFQWCFNYEAHPGGRIWVGWNPLIWKVQIISISPQLINCSVEFLQSHKQFFVSFFYGFNTCQERRVLWNELKLVSNALSDSPWAITGDFNVVLKLEEFQGGNTHWNRSISDFKDCTMDLGLTDLHSIGSFFTWWDSNTSSPKFRKLDRVLVNVGWHSVFPHSLANFLPRGVSDHCPAAICLGIDHVKLQKPFQFFNHLLAHPDFLLIVKNAWSVTVTGDFWYILTSKLRKVKEAFKQLNAHSGNLHSKVSETRAALFTFQLNLPDIPSMVQLVEEQHLAESYSKALHEEEVLLKQKSRIQWLKNGDGNNKFFFNSCKARWNVNKILSIEDDNGNIKTTHTQIASVATEYYKKFLGSTRTVQPIPEDISLPCLTSVHIATLTKAVTPAEIFNTFKGMGKNKSPGPDGFSAEFFVNAWSIIREDVCNAILHFFDSLNLPRIINSTAIALIPKQQSPSAMTHFRPISCCNVLYKCISKILASRLTNIMPEIISPVQSAFIPKRSIGDNIFIAQALCRDYHLNAGPPRCAIKLDLHKAFHTVNWQFLFNVLTRMGFPEIFLLD